MNRHINYRNIKGVLHIITYNTYLLYGRACLQVMAHTNWLLRGLKKRMSSRRCERAIRFFYCPISLGGKMLELIQMKIKKGLCMFIGKVRTITRLGTVVLLVLKVVYL